LVDIWIGSSMCCHSVDLLSVNYTERLLERTL
jgi:hypothetical protein